MENKASISTMNTSENISNLSNLIYLLRRVFENYLGLKPDEINEEDIFNLARKAEAKKLGENMDDYHSRNFLNYSWDCIGLYMELEQVLDIKVCNDDTIKIISFADLALYLNGRKGNKLTNDHLKIHPKYFDSLLAEKDKLKFLFVGRDPYPRYPMGIPFCKTKIEELKKRNCSGRYLLHGFGVDIDKYDGIKNTEEIFFSLLKDRGIGLVNASYFTIDDTSKKYQVKLSNYLNQLLFTAPKAKIITTAGAIKLFRKREEMNKSGYNSLEVPHLQIPIIEDKWSVICHPDFRNSWRKEHNTYWQQFDGINKSIKKIKTIHQKRNEKNGRRK